MPRPAPTTFKVGKVHGYLRGQVWYLCYHEHSRRHRVDRGRGPAGDCAFDGPPYRDRAERATAPTEPRATRGS